MKNLKLHFLSALLLLSAVVKAQFPTVITNKEGSKIKIVNNVSIQDALRNESTKYFLATTNAGNFSNISNGVTLPTQTVSSVVYPWYAVPQTAIVKDVWQNMGLGIVRPTIGRSYYIKKITIEFSHPSKVGIRTSKRGSAYGLAGDSAPFITGVFSDEVYEQDDVSRPLVIDYGSTPKRVKYGEMMSFSYARSENLSSNWSITIEGYNVSDDENFDAPFVLGVMGDSFSSISDSDELEYAERSTGLQGQWPVIVREDLKANGINSRISNIGLGGTNAAQWEIDVTNGLFNSWRPDIVLCNLGINDVAVAGYLRTTTGVDGIYTKSYKNIIQEYFRTMPKGLFVVLQIEDTDRSAQNTVFSSGIYSGLTQLQAGRLEVIALIAELKALHPTWDLVMADTSPGQTYFANTADQANFLTAEQGAGNRLHPNARLGQPKIATKVNQAVHSSTLYNRYKN